MSTRREFLATSLAAASCSLLSAQEKAPPAQEEVAFYLIGDTHFLASKEATEKMDAASLTTNQQLIDRLNQLPGTEIPASAGGGIVAKPRGLIHAGDLIDTGDKTGPTQSKMQQTEWASFKETYGLTGKDGRLNFPVYEVHGNHDGPQGDGLPVKGIIERNKQRPGLVNVSENGLHYSWDWGPIHFVNLGIVVGAVPEVKRRRRYNDLGSLPFLIADLAAHVGSSNRPVVLTHHIDIARYSTQPDPTGPATSKEWDPCDVHAYYEALKPYHVLAILFGHTHVRDLYKWQGTEKKHDFQKTASGHAIFNVDNSAHFASDKQAMLYFHYHNQELSVREISTADRWQNITWTPQVWKTKVNQPA
jgi:predicted phosphodiesterase